jgi:hypothetical protein
MLISQSGHESIMSKQGAAKTFRLAPMSPIILIVTLVLLALPVVFFIALLIGARLHPAPGILVMLVYVWIWFRFRPTRFIVHERSLEIVWPLKCREIPCDDITAVRLLNRDALRKEIGWGLRVGAGGLGGGFGWFWSRKWGLVQMYVSRTDEFVWIERKQNRPWLITPEDPHRFVQTLGY